jgi:hypothetical protein
MNYLSKLRRCLLVTGLVALAAGSALLAEEPAPAGFLALAGGDRILWIVNGKWDRDQQHFLDWIAWMDATSLGLSPLRMPPRFGQVQRWAEYDGALHLFVSIRGPDQVVTNHYSCSRPSSPGRLADGRLERRLPGDAVPAALAGGSVELPGVWAVVDASTAEEVRLEWEKYQRSQETQPAESQKAAAEQPRHGERSVASRPASPPEGAFLVVYDGAHWRPGFEGPPELRQAARAWLMISGERCCLFWQVNVMDETIHCVQRDKGDAQHWVEMPPVRFARPVAVGFAGVLNRQLVFAALVEDESEDHLRCESRVFMPGSRGWHEQPALKEADGKVLLLPADSVVGGVRDMLALLREGTGGPEVGLWSPADGRAVLAFAPVPVYKSDAQPGLPGRLQEMAWLMVVVAIILLVYWRRRESISLPLALPPGLATADFGRRGLAAVMDMAPAGAIVGLIWRAQFADYISAWKAGMEAQDTAPPASHGLFWAWLCFVLLYAGWCLAFELCLFASPGKRLLGCSVVSET